MARKSVVPLTEPLTELTPSQWVAAERFRDEQLVLGRAPGRADRRRVERGIRACYRRIGERDPDVVWVDGPITVAAHGSLLGELRLGGGDHLAVNLRSDMWARLWDHIRLDAGDHLGSQLRSGLWDQIWSHLGGQIRDQIWSHLGGQLWGHLGDQIEPQIRDQIEPHLPDLGDQPRSDLEGMSIDHWWQHWGAFFRVANEVVDAPVDSDTLAQLGEWQDAHSASAWMPLRGVAIVSDLHETISLDTQGRLHCESGPALKWRDGTAIWALQGVRVPDWAIDAPQVEKALEIENDTVRNAVLEHVGWDRVIQAVDATVIDTHPDPHQGTLYRLPETVAPANLLVAVNASPHRDGTWRTYGLLCDPACTTVVQAQASLLNVSLDQYRQFAGAS